MPGETPNPLAVLLTADYTPPEVREILDKKAAERLAGGIGALSLSEFLATSIDEEMVEERLRSDESSQLGHEVHGLLADAPITESFKDFIANEVRKAHALKRQVSDEVEPDRIGINSGALFSVDMAPQIEAECLRTRLLTMIGTHVLTVEGSLTPIVRHPREYMDEAMVFQSWLKDYLEVFHKNPFEFQDEQIYLLTATNATVVDPESDEGKAWGKMLEGLKKRPEDDGNLPE